MKVKKFFRYLSLIILFSACVWVYQDGRAFNFLETGTPRIEMLSMPANVGLDGQKLVFRVLDEAAGVREVRTYIQELPGESSDEASTERRLVNEEVYENQQGGGEKLVSVVLDPRHLKLREGRYVLNVEAVDLSIWENTATVRQEFVVDLTAPQIELVSKHHYGKQGGTLVVHHRVLGEQPARTGVILGDSFFEAAEIPASKKSEKTGARSYMTLVPIPDTYSLETHGQYFLAATDQAENMMKVVFSNHIRSISLNKDGISLSRRFLLKVLPQLGPKVDSNLSYEKWHEMSDEKLNEVFKKVNEKLREENVRYLKKLALDASAEQLPTSLEKPVPAKLTASFAERRTYKFGTMDSGSSVHEGYDLASIENDTVTAAAAGKVLHAGPLGIYGNAVFIDHGFGLSTLYGHLSSVAVKVGDKVAQSTKIGNTGATGLAGGDHLHFEVRVHGEAVHPKEWMDAHWVETRVREPITPKSVE